MNFFRRYILKQKPPEPVFFGLKKDKEDRRDIPYRAKYRAERLPESTFLKNINAFPFRYDQKDIGSCVGHGIVEAFQRVLQVNQQEMFFPSRLFAYYNARDNDQKGEDAGASIRNGIKAVNAFGLCKEDTWPYRTERFAQKPPIEAYIEGLDHQVLQYRRIYPVTKEAIQDALYRGFPVVYGKLLYESFLSDNVAKTGVVPYPRRCWEQQMGGHCMVIFDYDKDYCIELNSWGESWGFMEGCCKVPWKYVLDSRLAFDFWVIYKSE